MKRVIQLFIFTCLSISICAQTNTWLGPSGLWNDATKWSLAMVPTAAHDVIVPAGLTIDVNVAATVNSISVGGPGTTVDLHSNMTIDSASIFMVGSTINWSSGSLLGGDTLTNAGQINLLSNSSKYISGNSILNNAGEIIFEAGGDLLISQGVVNNLPSGVIDMKVSAGDISWSGGSLHQLNNFGTIKKTGPGTSSVICELFNQGGHIQVDSGAIDLENNIGKHLIGGTYDVAAGATLNWEGTIFASGQLTGNIDGVLNWKTAVSVMDTATFDFGGTGEFNWTSSALGGGGVLINKSTLNLSEAASKSIIENAELINEGNIKIVSSGDLLIVQGKLTNMPIGILDLQANAGNISWSGGSVHILNNAGTIKRSTTAGDAQIIVELYNSGTIQVDTGTLTFTNSIGKNLIGGTYNVAAGAIFNWSGKVFPLDTLSGMIDGELNWSNLVEIPDGQMATFNFGGSGSFNWTGSNLMGGGALTNLGVVNLTSNATKYILDSTELINQGTINIASSGDLYISDGVVTNATSGTIDLQENAGHISWSGGSLHVLNNEGLIKRTTTSGVAQIQVLVNNNGGTIQVDTGTLELTHSIGKHLNGGVYNVAAGAVLSWVGKVYPLDTLTGTIDGELNWSNLVEIPNGQMATFNFGGSGSFNWTGSNLMGGGALTNLGVVNLTSNATKYIVDSTELINQGTINIASSGDLYISDGVVTNGTSGTIDLQENAGHISWSGGSLHVLNNEGLIKRTTTSGVAQIQVLVNNNGGTIQVDTGTLELIHSIGKHLNGGVYNVAAGAVFNWAGKVYPLDTLTGTIDGELNWSNLVEIPVGQTATFNFGGSGNFNWTGSNLMGGGALTNLGVVNLTSNGAKYIVDSTELKNQGTINITSSGDLLISHGIVINEANGTIDMQESSGNISWSGGTVHEFQNKGLLKCSVLSGVASVNAHCTNSGVIDIVSGELEFQGNLGFTNLSSGLIKGTGILDLPSPPYFINQGTISPGASPGKLTIQGNYDSAPSAFLTIELNGLTPDSLYDQIAIEGSANVDGGINVMLNFAPTIGDSFTIVTSTGTLTSNLQRVVGAMHGGILHSFLVHTEHDKIILEFAETGCLTNRVFSGASFDGLYSASVDIISTNGQVVENTVFNAPVVILNPLFDMPLGKSLEIIPGGCP